VVIAAWWTKLRRTSRDLKDLDKLGINLETSLAAIALAPLPVDSVVTVLWAPMETLNSPSKAGSRNPPPPLSPLLVQLRTVSKMTAYGEMGDDAMGKQGRRASLAGVLAGGVGFMSCVLLCASLLILPLSLTSPSKAGSNYPPSSLSPLLVQLRIVSKMTAYGEMGDDAMGKQGRRDSLAGVLAGGVPLSLTSPSKAGSRNPPPPLSPLLVQLRTVSKMTAYGELGDDAMGKQGRRASLAGVLVGGAGRRGRGGGDGGGGGGEVWWEGQGGAVNWGGGVFDADCVNAFLAAALSCVMRAAGPIPAVAAASVLHSVVVGGFVAGDVGPLSIFGDFNRCKLGVFRF